MHPTSLTLDVLFQFLFDFILFSYSNLVFYHPVFMCTLKYRIRDEWWKRQKELKMYFAQKVFMLSSGGVWLVQKTVNGK